MPSDEMKRDCILKSDFLPHTVQGIRKFLEDHDGHDERLNGPVESWAFLYFQLRSAEDRNDWFPAGKWATLQRLESLLDACAVPGEERDTLERKE